MASREAAGHLIDNLTISIIDCNLVAIIIIVRGLVVYLADSHLIDIVIFVKSQLSLDNALYSLGIHIAVNQFSSLIIIHAGKEHDAVVSKLVQLFLTHLTALSHILHPVVPDALIHGQTLLTIVLTHIFAGNALHSALVFAHTSTLIFQTNLLVKTSPIVTLAAQTFEVNHTRFVDKQAISHRSYIITALHILVGKCNNPFTTLLKILQGVANLLSSSRRVKGGGTAFDVNTLDILVVFGLVNSADQIIESQTRHVCHSKQSIEGCAFFSPLIHRAVHFQHQY